MVSKEIVAWYNAKYQRLGNAAWRPEEAYPRFLTYLNLHSGQSMLDVGCGTGYLLKAAGERGLRGFGCDIADEGVEIAKANAPKAEISVGSAQEIPFDDNQFDAVTCLGVLEHLEDIPAGLREMQRVAKPDARYLIMVPNSRYYIGQEEDQKGTDQKDIQETLHTLLEWKSLFAKNGFRIVQIEKDMKWVNRKNPLKRLVRLSWNRLVPLSFAYQFIFVMESA